MMSPAPGAGDGDMHLSGGLEEDLLSSEEPATEIPVILFSIKPCLSD